MASNWATYLIGADPAVQKKLHEELDSIFGKVNIMPYERVKLLV